MRNETRKRRCYERYHPPDRMTGRGTEYGRAPTARDLLALMRMTPEQVGVYEQEMRRRYDLYMGKLRRQVRQERGVKG